MLGEHVGGRLVLSPCFAMEGRAGEEGDGDECEEIFPQK